MEDRVNNHRAIEFIINGVREAAHFEMTEIIQRP